MNELDKIWKEDKGLMVDWLRNNLNDITKYIKDLNNAIDGFNLQEAVLSNEEI